MTAYSPDCDACTRCHNSWCRTSVCLDDDPAALCDDCGAVTCDGCEHECPEAETRAVLDSLADRARAAEMEAS